jgi:hypothetical protein
MATPDRTPTPERQIEKMKFVCELIESEMSQMAQECTRRVGDGAAAEGFSSGADWALRLMKKAMGAQR